VAGANAVGARAGAPPSSPVGMSPRRGTAPSVPSRLRQANPGGSLGDRTHLRREARGERTVVVTAFPLESDFLLNVGRKLKDAKKRLRDPRRVPWIRPEARPRGFDRVRRRSPLCDREDRLAGLQVLVELGGHLQSRSPLEE